jgi:hypothetical protein
MAISLIAALMIGAHQAPATMTQCDPPSATIAEGGAEFRRAFGSIQLAKVNANVTRAFGQSCAKGVLKREPVQKAGSADPSRVFLINRPDANVATLMWRVSEKRELRFELEYPFISRDGSANIPTADEIEEAIYCAVRGATEEEQAESGRCLPD